MCARDGRGGKRAKWSARKSSSWRRVTCARPAGPVRAQSTPVQRCCPSQPRPALACAIPPAASTGRVCPRPSASLVDSPDAWVVWVDWASGVVRVRAIEQPDQTRAYERARRRSETQPRARRRRSTLAHHLSLALGPGWRAHWILATARAHLSGRANRLRDEATANPHLDFAHPATLAELPAQPVDCGRRGTAVALLPQLRDARARTTSYCRPDAAGPRGTTRLTHRSLILRPLSLSL